MIQPFRGGGEDENIERKKNTKASLGRTRNKAIKKKLRKGAKVENRFTERNEKESKIQEKGAKISWFSRKIKIKVEIQGNEKQRENDQDK